MIVLVVGSILATSCSAVDNEDRDSVGVLHELTAQVYADGGLTPDTAIAAFEAVFGPLDGSNPVTQPLGTSSLTFVLDWIDTVWDDITEQQQHEIEDILQRGLDRARPVNGREESHSGRQWTLNLAKAIPVANIVAQRDADFTHPEQIQPIVDRIAQQLSDLTGIARPTIVYDDWLFANSLFSPGGVGEPPPVAEDMTAAMAMPANYDGIRWTRQMTGPLDYCFITVNWNPQRIDALRHDAAAFAHILAHEVAHCFQFAALPGVELRAHLGRWLREGSAVWAAHRISPTRRTDTFWRRWLHEPMPLRQREGIDASAAVGLFAALDAAGIDPLAQLAAFLSPPDYTIDATYLNMINIVGEQALRTWATNVVNDAGLGVEWIAVVPRHLASSEPGRPHTGQVFVIDGSHWTADVPADEVAIYEILANGDPPEIVEISATGHGSLSGRVPLIPTISLHGSTTLRFCIEDRCTCDDGSTPLGVQVVPDEGGIELVVAIVGGANDGALDIAGSSLSAICSDSTVDPLGLWGIDEPAGFLTGAGVFNIIEIVEGPWPAPFSGRGLALGTDCPIWGNVTLNAAVDPAILKLDFALDVRIVAAWEGHHEWFCAGPPEVGPTVFALLEDGRLLATRLDSPTGYVLLSQRSRPYYVD